MIHYLMMFFQYCDLTITHFPWGRIAEFMHLKVAIRPDFQVIFYVCERNGEVISFPNRLFKMKTCPRLSFQAPSFLPHSTVFRLHCIFSFGRRVTFT